MKIKMIRCGTCGRINACTKNNIRFHFCDSCSFVKKHGRCPFVGQAYVVTQGKICGYCS